VKQLKFEIDKETMRGRPTNGALIAHTPDEFLFDFVLVMPGQQPVVTSRLVTSPRHAKALLRSLEDNVRRYEARFGVIPEPAQRQDEQASGTQLSVAPDDPDDTAN